MLLAHGQGIATVSLDPQGPAAVKDATGRLIKNFQLVGIIVTSPTPLTCSGAEVAVAATTAGFAAHLDEVTILNLTRAASFDKWTLLSVVTPVVSGTAAVAADSGLFNLSAAAKPRVQAGLTVLSTASALILPLIKSAAPNPSSTIADVLLFRSTYQAPFSGLIGASYPSPGPVVVPIKCTSK
jgi:hypothetical protein